MGSHIMSIVILHFQALRDESSLVATSTGIPCFDELERGNQNVLRAEVPLLHPTGGSREAVVTELLNQLQLSPPSGSPVGPNQHYPRLASAVEQPPESDGPVASLDAELTQRVENPSPSVPSNLVVLDTSENNQLSSDGYTSFRNAEASSQLGVMEALPNQAVSSTQLGMDPSINTLGGFGMNLPFHSPQHAATRRPTTPVYADPLTTELERLRKQTEQNNKACEDTVRIWLA